MTQKYWDQLELPQMLNYYKKNLDAIYKWAKEHNMEFNGSKFQLLRYGTDENLKSTTSYLDNAAQTIQESLMSRDLGIIMSSDGKFSNHIEDLVQKASNMSGWVLRTIYTREKQPMLTLYKALILSRLDYCCALWNPTSQNLCARIETVQRAFTRKIEGMSGLTYWQRLRELRLYSLQRRRERYIIIYVFKILHNLVPNCGLTFRTNARTGIHAEVPKLNSKSPNLLKKMRTQSFQYMAPTLYNLLPTTLRKTFCEPNPLVIFKRQLDAILSTVPDEPTVLGMMRAARSNSLVHQIVSFHV
jgi:ribonucleases P/MRP protein subunit RPP40